ncbi:hypothetical protein KYJ26_20405 [Bacillus sp. MCCB 382]|uniref:hypothetical protein n=1 Tax=Bacillus sp. MCCB 382 TaxID=2860197 RepID=UPI001C59898B|nr:hypothetical protein [Bacillus sp. MCCB 382]
MKAPYIKLNGKFYEVRSLNYTFGELHYIAYEDENGKSHIAWDVHHDLQTLLREGEQHERVS